MSEPSSLVGQTLGDYRFLSVIGDGGMGRVYLAEHVQYGVKYALKVLPAELSQSEAFVRRFRREAGVMASLKHPHIVEVHNMSQIGDTYFLVMDYVEGPKGKPWNLDDEIEARKKVGAKFTEEEVKELARQIAEAVAYAHDQGVIHRDLKPSNILLDPAGRVRVSDFGLAKVVGDEYIASKIHGGEDRGEGIGEKLKRTPTGAILGTYEFMSPEQKEGKPTDERSDVYSLGVMLYCLLTGRKPTGLGKLPSSIAPGIDRRWDRIVGRCLEPEPDARFQRVSELLRAIAGIGAPGLRKPVVVTAALILIVGGGILWALISTYSGSVGFSPSAGWPAPTITPAPTRTPAATAIPTPTSAPTPTPTLDSSEVVPGPETLRVQIRRRTPGGEVAYRDRAEVSIEFLGHPAPGGGIREYLWRLDGGEWRETRSQFVQLEPLAAGPHRFEVKVMDFDGAESRIAGHDILVLDNAPPTVAWTEPRGRDVLLAEGEALEVAARAEDPEGDEIAAWWWLVGSTSGSPVETAGGTEGRHHWSSLAGGLQTLYVCATDSAGKRSDWVECEVLIAYYRPTPTSTPTETATPTITPTVTSTPTDTPVIEPGQVDGIAIPDTNVVIEMVYIPGGSFLMGSPETEEGREADEGPVHEIKVRPFWLGKHEVTQAEWEAVMGANPSRFKGGLLPVESVSWNECHRFVARLNRLIPGKGFRLPTEAEWEYACRAGTATPFYMGGTISTDQANYDGNYAYGNGAIGVYRRGTTQVGTFPPNPWGLFDMHGNVWEWCQDWYYDNYARARSDGGAWESPEGQSRVLRGGSWLDVPKRCRSAERSWDFPDVRLSGIGFRLACGPAR